MRRAPVKSLVDATLAPPGKKWSYDTLTPLSDHHKGARESRSNGTKTSYKLRARGYGASRPVAASGRRFVVCGAAWGGAPPTRVPPVFYHPSQEASVSFGTGSIVGRVLRRPPWALRRTSRLAC
eukprot:scaffold56556_cov80-Phaeocystis_antarctica.AAC.1